MCHGICYWLGLNLVELKEMLYSKIKLRSELLNKSSVLDQRISFSFAPVEEEKKEIKVEDFYYKSSIAKMLKFNRNFDQKEIMNFVKKELINKSQIS